VSRNLTNLTPAQIEQFENTFRYFDKDETNTLNLSEMAAALASLGIVYGVSLFLFPRSCFDNIR
jgi:Ca2+-binding EF-hand superfamily protein